MHLLFLQVKPLFSVHRIQFSLRLLLFLFDRKHKLSVLEFLFFDGECILELFLLLCDDTH